jgi:Dolichyl-phosphate-mannose-protein mannosyltransferase
VSAEAQARTPTVGHLRRRSRLAGLASGWRLAVVLLAAAALISGFTILRRIDPFDEGVVLEAARRVMQGQVPHRDFLWAYGPADPYLMAGLFKAFGVSLLDWRILRVVSDAASALAVFVLARRLAGTKLALLAWLAAACAFAQPTSANPQAEAFAFGLWALVLVTGEEDTGRLRLGGAAALTAVCAAWRPDFGAYTLAACLTALAFRPGRRGSRMSLYSGITVALTAVIYAPLAAAVGPRDLYEAIVVHSSQQGSAWRLPFPLHFRGGLPLWPPGRLANHAHDALVFYVPLLLVIGLALSAVLSLLRRWELPRRLSPMFVLGAAALLYMLSRTDDVHTSPLMAAVVVLLAAVAAADIDRRLAVLPLAVLLLLALYGASNRLSALVRPPHLVTVHVAVADGAKDTPANARALERVVPLVRRLVPPGGYLYVAPRRSDLVTLNNVTLYVLTERNDPLSIDFSTQSKASAQRHIVSVLARVKPRVVVRWTDPLSSRPEPNSRGRSSGSHILDRWLGQNYRLLERDGFYDVLVLGNTRGNPRRAPVSAG